MDRNKRYKWLLLVDLDGTLWDNLDISSLTPPFTRIGKDEIADSRGVRVKLNSEVLKLISWAREHGALISTLSWNIPWKAYEALKTFGIVELFDYITVENTDRKDIMIKRLLGKLRDVNISFDSCEIIYIDDRDIHIEDIYRNIGDIFFLQYGRDFKLFDEARKAILAHLRNCNVESAFKSC